MVGHLDSTPASHFAGVAMGSMLVNVVGLSIGIGVAGTLGPFAAQDYGKGCPQRTGINFRYFTMCAAVVVTFAVTVCTKADSILLAMGQDFDVARCAQLYSRVAVWALPGQILIKGMQQVLDAQRDVVPGLLADACGAIFQLPLCWFSLKVGMGFQGAAYARVAVNSVVALALVAWISFSGRAVNVWRIPQDEPSTSFRSFLSLALPSTFATCVEWWAQEIMALLAGRLSNPSIMVSANGVLFSTAAIFYMVWIGTKCAISTRVGNLIGSGLFEQVPKAIVVSLSASTFQVLLVITLGWLYQSTLIRAFTVNVDVQEAASDSWTTMLALLFPYSFSFALYGILAGAGQQSRVGLIFLGAVLLSVPSGAYCAFFLGFGLQGLWLGNGLMFCITTVALAIQVMKLDWSKIATLQEYQLMNDAVIGA